jgi:hypothetical protein
VTCAPAADLTGAAFDAGTAVDAGTAGAGAGALTGRAVNGVYGDGGIVAPGGAPSPENGMRRRPRTGVAIASGRTDSPYDQLPHSTGTATFVWFRLSSLGVMTSGQLTGLGLPFPLELAAFERSTTTTLRVPVL